MSSRKRSAVEYDKCSKFKAVSSVSFERVSFEWQIENFSICPAKQNKKIRSPRFSSSDATWELWLYPNGETDCEAEVRLYLIKQSSDRNGHSIRYEIGLRDCKDASAKANFYEDNFDEGNFDEVGNGWGGTVIRRSELLGNKRKNYLPGDILTVYCDMVVTENVIHGKAKYSAEDEPKYSDVSALDNLSNDFSSLYENSRLCDVILKADDKEFPAHKAILSARSPVFAAMFEHDMEEKRSSEVNLSDLEASALKSFLYFIYSGKINEMSMKKAISLFKIAHKYVVNELKTKCMYFISSHLSVDNFCEIAVLGDTYSEVKLKDSVKDFLYEKELEAVVTSQWEALLHDKPRLAAELLQAVCINRRKNQKK